MKTLKQKAKAYDEAIGKAAALYKASEPMSGCNVIIETLFPELVESKDEKIRKALIEHFKFNVQQILYDFSNKDVLAWLEKQGEQKYTQKDVDNAYLKGVSTTKRMFEKQQKPTDTVEPKFKVGDWVVQGCNILKIRCVGDEYYCFETVGGYVDDMLVSEIDSLYHLWTIQDAKDGDVLTGKVDGDNYILIFKQVKDGWVETHGHYYDSVNRFCVPSQLFCRDYQGSFTPATKEQRDQLEKAMADAGYTFDFENKELKKIEQNLAENAKPQSSTPMSYGKELEKRMYEACNRFFAPNTDSNRYSASDLFYAGVKAERDLNTLAWSEEDEPQKELAASYLTKFDEKFPILPTLKGKQLADYKNFLNKCQQIFGLRYWGIRPIQAKLFEKLSLLWAAWGAEHLQGLGQTGGDMDNEISMWSEEDDQYVEDVIALIQRGLSCHTIGQVQEWLQSLKGRVQPQNTWKPSEGDIIILEKVFKGELEPKIFQATQQGILEQLKKLKEE